MVLVLRVFPVSVDSTVGGRLTGFAFDTNSGALLAAQITKIPLISQPYIKNDKKAVLWRSITSGEMA